MATVTGFTAEKMQEIQDGTIVSADIVAGDLIFTRYDGSTLNVGSVEGPTGPTGPTGPPADFAGYSEALNDLGNVSGLVTINFATYNVWRINPTGAITIAFSNLPASTRLASATLIVGNSTYAITWPVGTKFPNGSAPVLSGETWLSLAARSTHVTAGLAWPAVA